MNFLLTHEQMRSRAQQQIQTKELMLEGVSGIVEGLNPKLIRSKLEAYSRPKQIIKKKKEKPAGKDEKPIG